LAEEGFYLLETSGWSIKFDDATQKWIWTKGDWVIETTLAVLAQGGTDPCLLDPTTTAFRYKGVVMTQSLPPGISRQLPEPKQPPLLEGEKGA